MALVEADDVAVRLVETGLQIALLRIWGIKQAIPASSSLQEIPADQRETFALTEASVYGYELIRPDGSPIVATIEPSELFEPDRPNSCRGRLRTSNHAGLLAISVRESQGNVGFAAIDIVSSKLNYEDEYRWMLRDITADLAEAAISRFGATQGLYAPSDGLDPRTLYQRFAFVQAILASADFQQALNQILARPFVAWERSTRLRATSSGVRSGHSAIRSLVTGSVRRQLTPPLGLLKSVPRDVREESLAPSSDNLPNQFIRHLLENWRGLAQEVHDALSTEATAEQRIPAPVARGLQEADRLMESIDAALTTPLFRAVSRLRRFPLGNQVLLRRPGYRDLVRLHQQTELAAVLTWDGADSVFGAGQRDIATLYEYWVFLQVGQIVAELCEEKFDYSGLFTLSRGGLQLRLRKRRSAVIHGIVTQASHRLRLELWFNRPFKRAHGESWTRDMRPDLSLRICPADSVDPRDAVWLHFDAKYRVERLAEILGTDSDGDETAGDGGEREVVREDLLKMHAYRDAIRRSSGAFVVYPGDNSPAQDESFFQYHEILPGLGAFALRPGDHGGPRGAAGLRSFIQDVLRHVSDPLNQERRIDYWTRTAIGSLPDSRRSKPNASREVEGLRFLKRPPADESLLLARAIGPIQWHSSERRLLFRIDADSAVPKKLFECQWAAVAVSTESVLLLQIEHDAAVTIEVRPGDATQAKWLAFQCREIDALPDWLNVRLLERTLQEKALLATSWADLAIQSQDQTK